MFLLALRLVRGGGWLRLVLMSCGVCVMMLAVLLSAMVPRVYDAQRNREGLRAPVAVAESSLHALTSTELYRGAPLTKVFVSGTAGELPQGLARLPNPGEVIASPELARLMAEDSGLATRVAGTVIGTIGDAGLRSPDELFAYVGETEPRGLAIGAFGSRLVDPGDQLQLGLELATLVGVPALALLVVVSRLSLTTRLQRLRALRLIGVSARNTARLFAAELAVVVVIGTIAALAAYPIVQRVLGSAGVVGFRWFAVDAEVPVLWSVALTAGAGVGAYVVGFWSLRRVGSRPRERRWWFVEAGVSVFSAAVLVFTLLGTMTSHARISNTAVVVIVVTSVVLTIVGIRGAARVVPVIAAWGATAFPQLPAAIVLGLRMSRDAGRDVLVTTTIVGCFVLATGFSAAFVQAFRVVAMGSDASVTVDIALDDLAPGDRAALPVVGYVDVPAVTDQTNDSGDTRAAVYVGDCGAIAQAWGASVADCTAQRGRLVAQTTTQGPAPELTAHEPLTVTLSDGTTVQLAAPDEVIRSDRMVGYFAMLVPLSEAPWAMQVRGAVVHARVALADYDALLARITRAVPGVAVLTQFKDRDAVGSIQRQEGVLAFATVLGLALSLAAFAVAAIGQRIDQRRSAAALRVLGVSRGVLVVSAIVRCAVPVLLVAAYFAALAAVAGQAFLQATGSGTSTEVVSRVLIAGGGSVIAAVVVGVVVAVGAGRDRAELVA